MFLYIYILYIQRISTLPEISFLLTFFYPSIFFESTHFLGSGWEVHGFFVPLAGSTLHGGAVLLPRSTLEQKWEKHQQRHEGNDTKETGWKWGSLLRRKKHGEGFPTKGVVILLFFLGPKSLISLIPRSYA